MTCCQFEGKTESLERQVESLQAAMEDLLQDRTAQKQVLVTARTPIKPWRT